MKKLLLLVVCLFSFSMASFADNDKPIAFDQLPVKAQNFIKKNFNPAEVVKAFVDEDGDEYEVRLKGGIKIEFGEKGNWKEIEGKKKPVPAKLVPAKLRQYVKEQFGPKVKVVEMSREQDEIEVKLSNGKELDFDRKTKTVKVDD